MKKGEGIFNMKAKNFEYDSELDNFYIYSNEENEEVLGSIALGNFIYDIGNSGKVLGLEIDNASQVFNVSVQLLINATNAKINVITSGNMLMLKFNISLYQKELMYTNIIPRNKISIAT